jgi:hypothetical protein
MPAQLGQKAGIGGAVAAKTRQHPVAILGFGGNQVSHFPDIRSAAGMVTPKDPFWRQRRPE